MVGGGGQFLDFMGGHSCYEGDIELMGVPPTGENPTPQVSDAVHYHHISI